MVCCVCSVEKRQLSLRLAIGGTQIINWNNATADCRLQTADCSLLRELAVFVCVTLRQHYERSYKAFEPVRAVGRTGAYWGRRLVALESQESRRHVCLRVCECVREDSASERDVNVFSLGRIRLLQWPTQQAYSRTHTMAHNTALQVQQTLGSGK